MKNGSKSKLPESVKRLQATEDKLRAAVKTAKKAVHLAKAKYKAIKAAFKKARKNSKKAAKRVKFSQKECPAPLSVSAVHVAKKKPLLNNSAKKAFPHKQHPQPPVAEAATASPSASQPEPATGVSDSSNTGA